MPDWDLDSVHGVLLVHSVLLEALAIMVLVRRLVVLVFTVIGWVSGSIITLVLGLIAILIPTTR